jgi:hypothetical protein
MSFAFLRSFKKSSRAVAPTQTVMIIPAELQRIPDRERLLELLDECASTDGYARRHAPLLCSYAADALRYAERSLPRKRDQSAREIALSLTEEEREGLLTAAWAQVDDGDGKIKMHPGTYPGRLQSLGLCQNVLIPATWTSQAEQRAVSQYGITRFGLIVAMHLKPTPSAEQSA